MDNNILNIHNIYEYNNEEYNKILIQNIYEELNTINNTIFDKNNLIEILKIYEYSLKNEKIKYYVKIFLKIFKILSVDYVDQYEYYLIIFSFFQLLKEKHNLINILKKYELLNINIIYNSIEEYINKLSSKSNLIQHLNMLNKTNLDISKLNYLFSCFSKDVFFYYEFDSFYDIFINSIELNSFNKTFIFNNKLKCEKYYKDTKKNMEELYGAITINKYKNINDIRDKFFYILLNISKL